MKRRTVLEIDENIRPAAKKLAKKIGRSTDWLINKMLIDALGENLSPMAQDPTQRLDGGEIDQAVVEWMKCIPLNQKVYKPDLFLKFKLENPGIAWITKFHFNKYIIIFCNIGKLSLTDAKDRINRYVVIS